MMYYESLYGQPKTCVWCLMYRCSLCLLCYVAYRPPEKDAQSDGSVFKVCFGTSAPRRCTYDGARDGTPEACVDVARSLLGHRFEGQFPAQRRIDGPSVSFLRQVSRRADFGAVGRPAPLPAGPWTRLAWAKRCVPCGPSLFGRAAAAPDREGYSPDV